MANKALLIGCALIGILNFEAAHGQQKKYSLWYEQPAPNRGGDFNVIKNGGFPFDEDWERWSLPIGNGYMGACIFGRTDTERIQLTEKTLGNKSLWGLGGIENFAEIYLDINHASPANYRRELSMNDAVCTVRYQHDGVNYRREYFANYPNNVIAVKLKADRPGKVTFTLRPILPYLREYGADKNGRTGKVTAQGDLITMTGRAQFYNLPYEAQIKVLPYGGRLEAGNDVSGDHGTITVQQADSVVLYIHARTAYQLNSDLFCLPADKKITGEHPHRAATECIAKAVEKGYETLRKHSYPAILGMSKFLSKTLKPSEDGCLLAEPSSSPEQQFADGKYYVTKGCAFDQGMIWENHHDLLKAAHILRVKDPFLKTVEEQIGKLDTIQIGESGQIKEFREEQKYGDIGEPHHRHISHLCALYPGTLINSATAEWMKAAIVTLNNRGDKSTGWAMAHRLNLWARTKDGDRAYRLYQQMQRQCIVENLWDVHPPFQIDGNFGATAGVAEMLLQSHEGCIEPLPALPEAWSRGAYDGLVARGNFVVSVAWEHRTMVRMSILSRKGGECIIKYDGIDKAVVSDAKGRKVKTVKCGNNMLKFATRQGNVYRVEWI